MSRPVQFGTMGRMFPPIERVLEVPARAEAQGWDYIDYADQLMGTHPEGMLPDKVTPPDDDSVLVGASNNLWYSSFELLSAASVLTNRLGIHMGVVDVLRHNPALFAQKLVTVSHMSHGRDTWCVASGEAKQFEPYGERRDKPIARMEEAIRIMYALWESGGEPISRDSEFWPLNNAVFGLPLYEGRRPRMLPVGGSPRILQLAGELCDGWMTYIPGGHDPKDLKQTIDTVKKAASDAGRDPEALDFVAMCITVLGENDDEAWRLARHPVNAWVSIAAASMDSGASWKKWGFEHPLGENWLWPKDMRTTRITAEDAIKLAAAVPEAVTDLSWVWGSPARVADKIQTYIDAGITHITFYNNASMADPSFGHKWGPLVSDAIVRLGGKPLNLEA